MDKYILHLNTLGKYTLGKYTLGNYTLGKYTFGKYAFGKVTYDGLTDGRTYSIYLTVFCIKEKGGTYPSADLSRDWVF